jgi:1-deoxy-D-xylulose-5-phosphate synthase
MSLLARITDPSDLDELSWAELDELAEEIRAFLLDRISRSGGHLSPNLGIVELTIALHRAFDSPTDRIFWDVGHQAYVHKLLTGRQEGFERLRSFGGMSGYPSRSESEHDFVENSHASTSISYALGDALAGGDGFSVAVIGDGAFTGGQAYEALSHLSVLRPEKVVVVLNDNGRSYAPTVGGLAMLAGLAGLRFDPRYEWAKRTTGRMLRNMPVVGDTADELAMRFKEAVKQVIEPSTVFDTLGLKYSGRIDGHDIPLIEETLRRAKEFREPVVVHIVTEKGNGYEPAIADEVDKLHGVSRFDIATGQPLKSETKYTDVAGIALVEAARNDPDLVGISAAMVSSTGLQQMSEEFPDRVIDVGIAEQHAVGLAAGLAMAGKRPVVAMYSTFLQRAIDQVTMDVCLHDLPVTFLLDRAGVTGPDGSSHHGVFDISLLRGIPNLVIGSPADATELAGMVASAVTHDGPVVVRYPKAAATSLPAMPVDPVPIGTWVEVQSGSDVVFIANGRMVEACEKAAADLEQHGISCGVLNARWIKPVDARLAEWVEDYRLIVTVEDGVTKGGFGAAVLEHLAGTPAAARVEVMGVPDRFLPFGSAGDVLESIGLDPASIGAHVLGLATDRLG